MTEQAVLAAVGKRDAEIEEERKHIAELTAAEEEAAKRLKRSDEPSERASPISPVASPVIDAGMIAQIAERVKADLSVGDLERKAAVQVLQEATKSKAGEPSESSKDRPMEDRVSELQEMQATAKERRSQVVDAAEEKKETKEGEDQE